MKRITSVLLALVMLLSACAMAAGSEVRISNIRYSDNGGSELNFSGIELEFAGAEKDGKTGGTIAVKGNGAELARAVLWLDELGACLSATGISDVYSIPVDLIADFAVNADQNAAPAEKADAGIRAASGLVQAAGDIYMSGVESVGTTEVYGVNYEAYSISIEHEQFMELLAMLDEFVALYPEILAETGYSSLTEMFEGENIRVNYDGDMLVADGELMIDLYGYANGEAVANVYASVYEFYDEDEGCNAEQFYLAFYGPEDPSENAPNEEMLAFLNVVLLTDPETGDFSAVYGSFGEDTEDEDSIYFEYSPAPAGGAKMNYVNISAMDYSFDFSVRWGDTFGVYNFAALLTDVDEDVDASLAFVNDGGEGSIVVKGRAGADEVEFAADITVSESDGAWLPEAGETVEISEIDQAQLNKLMMEGMGVLGRLVSGLTAASPDFADLLAELMQP